MKFEMTHEWIEDAATKAAMSGLRLAEIRVPADVLADYNRRYFAKERIVIATKDSALMKERMETTVSLMAHNPNFLDEKYDDEVVLIYKRVK